MLEQNAVKNIQKLRTKQEPQKNRIFLPLNKTLIVIRIKTMKILIAWLLLFSFTGLKAAQEPIHLFSQHISPRQELREALHFYENKKAVIRFQEVFINSEIKRINSDNTGDALRIHLFDDKPFDAIVQRVNKNNNGTRSFTALTKGYNGYITAATTDNRTLATIYYPDRDLFYKIISEADTQRHYLLEMDARDRDILESSPPIIPELDEKDLQEQQRIANYLKDKKQDPDEWVNIDVMVLYTPNARNWGNEQGGGIENVVALAMANAQLVLDNSEVMMTATLVHSEIFSFDESGGSSSALSHVTNSSVAHSLREEHHADLVALFARVNDSGGVAWLLDNKNGIPSIGFSLTRVQQAASSYTHIHEMGHNMGCHHHKYQNVQPGPTYWNNWPDNLWSAGWRWQGADGGYYCSVMTYAGGGFFEDGITHSEVPYFSNPDLTFEGVPTGHPFDGDNARTLREIKHVIAAYRVSGKAEIFTAPIKDIELVQALSGGTIATDAGTPVIKRGMVWDVEPNPSLERHQGISFDGEGIGTFTSVLTDLSPSTTYYATAYAETEAYTTYGVQRVFNTQQATMANIRTNEVELVTHNAAYVGGEVTQSGNSEVTERGVVWGKHSNPSLSNNEGFTLDGIGAGVFNSIISGLKPETAYFYRAYATNLGGTNYGAQENFTTLYARIYPNPFIEWLYVEFYNESSDPVYLVITNAQGGVVKRNRVTDEGDVSKKLNLAHLPAGIFTFSIESKYDFPVWQLLKLNER